MSSHSQRKRVLILFNRVPFPLNNGGAVAMFSTVKEYASCNFEVHILCMNTTKHFADKEEISAVFGQLAIVEVVDVDNKIKLKDAFKNLFSRQSYILQRFASDNYDTKLSEMLSQTAYDIIHADALSSLLYLQTIRKYSKGKIFYRAQNIESQIWKSAAAGISNPLKKTYLQIQAERLEKFEWKTVKEADVILPISATDKAEFEKRTSCKVMLLPVQLEVAEKFTGTNAADDIFFIGAMDWFPNEEGLRWFIKNVWIKVSEKFPSYKFYIAGRQMPPWVRDLKENSIIVVGEVKDAKEFMLSHGIMIAPVLFGSGIRIKIAEAFALGKVVIATTAAAEGLEITNGENILIADSAEEFMAGLLKCRDAGFRNKLGANAHRFAMDNFSRSLLPQILRQCGI